MADNTLQAGTDTIATDDLATINGGAVGSAVKVQRVKVMYGLDGDARDVSPSFPMPIMVPDAATSGTLSATDAVVAAPAQNGTLVTGTPTAGSYVALALTGGDGAWVVQLTGTFGAGTVWFEASPSSTTGVDGSWTTLSMRQIGTAGSLNADGVTVGGVYRGNTGGMAYLRVRITGATAPSVGVVIRASDGAGPVALNAPLPAGSYRIGSVSKAPAATGTITAPALSLTSFTVLAANVNRLGAVLTNDSANIVYLGLTASAVTTTAYTLQIPAGGYYELPSDGCGYVGQITGIALVATGNLRVTELTT